MHSRNAAGAKDTATNNKVNGIDRRANRSVSTTGYSVHRTHADSLADCESPMAGHRNRSVHCSEPIRPRPYPAKGSIDRDPVAGDATRFAVPRPTRSPQTFASVQAANASQGDAPVSTPSARSIALNRDAVNSNFVGRVSAGLRRSISRSWRASLPEFLPFPKHHFTRSLRRAADRWTTCTTTRSFRTGRFRELR